MKMEKRMMNMIIFARCGSKMQGVPLKYLKIVQVYSLSIPIP
jgi:hypothetical protein